VTVRATAKATARAIAKAIAKATAKATAKVLTVKLSASFRYLSGSEPYRGFRNMQSLLEQTVCYR